MLSAAQQEALDAFEKYGGTRAAAKALNLSRSAFRDRLARAQAALGLPEGAKSAIETTGLSADTAHHGWRIVQHEDGSRDSVFWKVPAAEGETPEDVLDQIAERLDRVQAATIPNAPPTAADIRNFLPLFDVHLGMRAGDFGTDVAVKRLLTGITDVLLRAPPADTTIILNGGDFTEHNDESNQTPTSKHPLNIDTDYDDVIDIAVDVTVAAIEAALQRSQRVVYKALRGNHDPNTARILRAALRQRYRGSERVEIDIDGLDFFAHEWSGNMICAHHGDLKAKPQDTVMRFAAAYPEAWGRTRYRDLWTGHMHHLQTHEFPGMTRNQVRAVAPAGGYATRNMLLSQSEIVLVTYRAGGGRHSTTTHCF